MKNVAEKLFELPNVSGVFFGSDFISVTKSDGDWQQVKPAILGAIMEHYMSGAPLVPASPEAGQPTTSSSTRRIPRRSPPSRT